MWSLRKKKQRLILNQLVVVFCLFMIAVAAFLVYLQNQRVYEDSVTKSREDILRLTRLVGDNAELSLLSVDLILRRASERQYFNDLFGGNLKSDMRLNLNLWSKENPHIARMALLDENGVVRILSDTKSGNSVTLKEGEFFPMREHFMQHKQKENVDLMITAAEKEQSGADGMLVLSRRLEKLDGSFGGLIVALVDGGSLTDFIRAVEVGSHTQVAIVWGKDQVLVGGDESAYRDLFRQQLERHNRFSKAGNDAIDLASTQLKDGLAFFTFKALKRFPLTVSLLMQESDILRNYYTNRYYYFIFLGVFVGFTITIAFFTLMLTGQMRRVQLSEQRALLASQTKSDFLARISHELRTPLNAIIGFSEMLQAEYFGKITPEQSDRIKDINGCGTHLLSLINDLLDFSKSEAGKLILNAENIYLGDVLDEALRIMKPQADKSGVKLIDHTADIRPTLNADARKLKQILINLLSNAVKFTPKGGTVTLSTAIESKGNLLVTVEDTGVGVAAEDIPKAFGVFEQVGAPSGEGTGLGLPLSKVFVELHGGDITMQGLNGRGTKVSFTIPRERLTDPSLSKKSWLFGT